MSWFKIDDKLHAHRKVQRLIRRIRNGGSRGPNCHAMGLWAIAGSWCGQAMTDGFVPDYMIQQWDLDAFELAGELVDAELWIVDEQDGDRGYRFVNWLTHNPSADEQKMDNWKKRRKDEVHRDQELKSAVLDRDGNACRYCGVTVKWSARNGATAGTFDHVDPEGASNLLNVVVACSGCNSAKGRRTPEEWGHELRPEARRSRAGRGAARSRTGADPQQGAKGTRPGRAGSGTARVGSGADPEQTSTQTSSKP